MKPLKPLTALKRKPKTLVELFRDPRRWIKGSLRNPDTTACCVRGGINFLLRGDPYNFPHTGPAYRRFNTIERKIARAAGLDVSRVGFESFLIPGWNNDPSLTHKEFLRVLKQAGV